MLFPTEPYIGVIRLKEIIIECLCVAPLDNLLGLYCLDDTEIQMLKEWSASDKGCDACTYTVGQSVIMVKVLTLEMLSLTIDLLFE